MATYTLKELEGYSRLKLVKMATYLNLDVSSKARKSDIVNDIYMATSTPSVEEEPLMSVRIRRIKEANKEN